MRTKTSLACKFPASFKKEAIALKSLTYRLKFCLLNTMYDFLEFSKSCSYINFYDVPLDVRRSPVVRFSIPLVLDFPRDALIYEMYLTHSPLKRALIMRNAYIHTARKVMKINNPKLDIFIFDFNKNKNVGV